MRHTQIDGHRLMYHPGRVSDWLENRPIYPIYVEIGPTNRCNHRCIFCALDYLVHGGVDFEPKVMFALLEDLARCGVKSVMFAGEGEPLLHPSICEFVGHARAAGLDVALTTNGALLDEKKAQACLPSLSWIRISLDAGTPETYALVHGISRKEDFERTIGNIRTAADIRNRLDLATTIGVQALVIPENAGELTQIARRVKEAGADNVQFKPYSQHPLSKNRFAVDYGKLEGMEAALKAFEDDSFQVHFRRQTMARIEMGKDYPECYGLPFFTLIDARGNVLPCNLYYNHPEFTYGNLHEKSFPEIWQGETRKQVVEKIKGHGIDGCRNGCRLEAVNRYLHELRHPHPHVNFI